MKWIFSFLFAFVIQFSSAQAYHPFPDSNATWSENSYYYWTMFGTNIEVWNFSGEQFSLKGDTLINSKKYSLVQAQYIWSYTTDYDTVVIDFSKPVYLAEIIGGIREDSSKVWFFNFNYPLAPIDSEVVIYDFNLSKGESILYPYLRTVQEIDSIQLNDGSFRRRIVFLEDGDVSDSWIEGIGSSLGFLGLFHEPYHLGLHGTRLNCFVLDGEYLYERALPTGVTCDSLNPFLLTTAIAGDSSANEVVITLDGIIRFTPAINFRNITIINSTAQIVLQSDDPATGWVDFSGFPSGMYFLIIRDNLNKISVKKFIKI